MGRCSKVRGSRICINYTDTVRFERATSQLLHEKKTTGRALSSDKGSKACFLNRWCLRSRLFAVCDDQMISTGPSGLAMALARCDL
jgi:hypothetical protein